MLNDEDDFAAVFNTIEEIAEDGNTLFPATIITLTVSDLVKYDYKLVRSGGKK